MSKKKEECYASYGLCRCSKCRPKLFFPNEYREACPGSWLEPAVAPYPGPFLEQAKRPKLASTHHGVATEICLRGCCCAQCRPAKAALQAMQREDEKRYLKSRVRIDKSVALAAGVTLLGVFLTVSNPPHMGVLLLVFCWLLLHVFEVERYQP